MDLLEILKNNGTGFLEGNCRISMPLADFSEPDRNGNYVGKLYDISFSLQDKNLGEFQFAFVNVNSAGRIFFTKDIKINDSFNHQIQLICIENSDYPRFGKFEAFLLQKNYSRNSFFK